MQISVVVHPHESDRLNRDNQMGQDLERLPEEDVSIVEEDEREDQTESVHAMGGATFRRKLYFNPSYFEPDLLKVSTLLETNTSEISSVNTWLDAHQKTVA